MIIDIDGNEIFNVDTGETLLDMRDLSSYKELVLVSIVNALVTERDGLQDDILAFNQQVQDLQEQIEMMEDNY